MLYGRALATASSFLTAAALQAQTTSEGTSAKSEPKTDSPALRVLTRDANSSTVEWTELLTNAVTGEVTQQNHDYVTVGNGLNYRDESGAWRESQDLIELLPDGSAAALRGPNKVRFNPNLNTADAISVTTVSNRLFRTFVVGIYYFDAATGQSALVATVQDSIGELLPPNQILYRDAFKGLKADVRVTCTKSAYESDVILLEKPLPPENFGLNPKSVRLEIWHEWLDAPAPNKQANALKAETDPLLRETMVEPDLIDEALVFGDLWLPLGKPFEWTSSAQSGTNEPAQVRVVDPSTDANQVLVAKRWLRLEDKDTGQRDLLIESVDWRDIEAQLDALPRMAMADQAVGKDQAALERSLPERRLAKKSDRTMKVASLPYRAKGYVFDYIAVTGGTSYTFASGVSYYISSSASFSGTVTFQPSCVIKLASNGYLLLYGPIVCNGTLASPSILTSKDDNLYGDTILSSTGNPVYAANPAMWIYYTAVPQDEWYLTKKSVGFQLVPCDRHGDEKETPKPKANEM